jgi:hypothetical protein
MGSYVSAPVHKLLRQTEREFLRPAEHHLLEKLSCTSADGTIRSAARAARAERERARARARKGQMKRCPNIRKPSLATSTDGGGGGGEHAQDRSVTCGSSIQPPPAWALWSRPCWYVAPRRLFAREKRRWAWLRGSGGGMHADASTHRCVNAGAGGDA